MRSLSGEGSDTKWRWAPFLILATAFCFFGWRSWRTWPDVLVDFGHELYIPWRLSEGDRLYSDIAFTMGPLSQSFNALLFRLFGVSLNTLIAANLVILAGITTLLYAIFCRCSSRVSATAATLFFLAVFAFSQYATIGSYNYVCPYRHEMTHGLALGLLELYCLLRFSERNDRRWLAAAGLSLGLVSLTKAELLLPAFVCAGIALFLGRIARRSPSAQVAGKQRGILRDGLIVFCPAAIAPCVSLVLFATTRGLSGAWHATYGWLGYVLDPRLTAESGFYQSISGFDDPIGRCTTIVLVTASYFGGLVVAYVAEFLLGRAAKRRAVAVGLGVITAIAAPNLVNWLATQAGFDVIPGQWSQFAGALPVLMPIVVIVTGRKLLRRSRRAASKPADASQEGATWALFLISVYSLALLPKVFLNPQWGHYGFVLTMPATLVLVHLTIVSIPEWLRRKPMPVHAFTAVAAGLLAACALVQFLLWDRASQAKTLAFGGGKDQFYLLPDADERALPMVKTLEFLRRTVLADETLVVLPEGTMLNYMLRARNPTPFLMLNPWEIDAQGGEAVIEKSLFEARPDYFVVVSMEMSVHGRGNFGDPGFGEGILNFIKSEYQLVDARVSPDNSFQCAVFHRKLPPEEAPSGEP